MNNEETPVEVPEGVLEGMKDIKEGNTVGVEELREILDF